MAGVTKKQDVAAELDGIANKQAYRSGGVIGCPGRHDDERACKVIPAVGRTVRLSVSPE